MAPEVLESLRTARGWVNYNPGPPFDFLAGAHPATEEQLTAELGRLYEAGFRGLVTNAVAFGLERAPQIAKDCGFEHVVAKIWWQNDELLATEKANLDAAVDAVDAVCVGNEIIQKGIADHDRLIKEVDDARERFGLPVTTGFQPPDWLYFPDLATEIGDFSFLNVHPWWVLHQNDPLTAANWVEEAYELVARTPGIPTDRVVVVQETSFPSGAVPPEAAPGATPENQKRFYEALMATDVPFVWFLSVDSPQSRKVSPPGGFGGLWDENWEPKPVVELLTSAL
jgi:exo-beta-1,3-glucanase (GH17 family)